MLSRVEHEKKFITSGPDKTLPHMRHWSKVLFKPQTELIAAQILTVKARYSTILWLGGGGGSFL